VTRVVCYAPVAGWLSDLSKVPDAAFAGGMIGDGVAIDPVEPLICAPFDGVVIGLPASKHAVTVRSDAGIELLIHVGLETVSLAGAGFFAHVAEGARVRKGDPLLTLDFDILVGGATSLMSPIVVVGGGHSVSVISPERAVKSGEAILTVDTDHTAAAITTASTASRKMRARLPHGLHARPAARIRSCARGFDARTIIWLGDRPADATSIVAMMGLGVSDGDELHLSASGPQAEQALEALTSLIAAGLEQDDHETQPPPPPLAAHAIPAEEGERILTGIMAAPGLTSGRAVRWREAEIAPAHNGRGPAHEREALRQALVTVRSRLRKKSVSGPLQQQAIFEAHLGFLDDPGILDQAYREINEGRSAGMAWRSATRAIADVFRATGDARTSERAADLLDLERQVLTELTSEMPVVSQELPPGSILIADDLLPSQLIGLEDGMIGGFCTSAGGATSHVAILANAMDLPALVAMGPALNDVPDGAQVVLDASAGLLVVHPSPRRSAAVVKATAAATATAALAHTLAQEPCRTADDIRIEVFVNLGDVTKTAQAVASGAEGCGLLRTEFLFLERRSPPSEDEQLAQYQAIADALDGRPLIVRTLDAGGDKPLPYLPSPPEENPALGLRGVRSGLRRPDILMAQLRAICRVRSRGDVAIMLPMIATVAEVIEARALLKRAAAELGAPVPLLGIVSYRLPKYDTLYGYDIQSR